LSYTRVPVVSVYIHKGTLDVVSDYKGAPCV
jgi:hypothetical protein